MNIDIYHEQLVHALGARENRSSTLDVIVDVVQSVADDGFLQDVLDAIGKAAFSANHARELAAVVERIIDEEAHA